MNRRKMLLATAAAVPAIGVWAAPAATSRDALQREAIASLCALSDDDANNIALLRIALVEGHYVRPYVVELLESGISMDEVQARVTERVHHNIYGPKGPPIYDEHGRKIGGGSLNWRDEGGDDA